MEVSHPSQKEEEGLFKAKALMEMEEEEELEGDHAITTRVFVSVPTLEPHWDLGKTRKSLGGRKRDSNIAGSEI
jgi:hypothetical protein